ncbi:hypothetical protein BGZ90_008204, partial [Linnemannia elongata]
MTISSKITRTIINNSSCNTGIMTSDREGVVAMTWTMSLTTNNIAVNITISNNRASRAIREKIEGLHDALRGPTTLTVTDHLLDTATHDHRN